MTQPVLRLLIQEKLAAGHLPRSSIPRYWDGPGKGETCDACEETVTKDQQVIENLDTAGGGIQFHVACFYLWNVERQLRGNELCAAALVASAELDAGTGMSVVTSRGAQMA